MQHEVEGRDQLAAPEWLDHVALGPGLLGLYLIFRAGMGRDADYRQVLGLGLRAEPREYVEPVHGKHVQIQKDGVDVGMVVKEVQGLDAVGGFEGLMPHVLEDGG
ncbi:hypothetical protein D3C72_1644690 [compost metagenome]